LDFINKVLTLTHVFHLFLSSIYIMMGELGLVAMRLSTVSETRYGLILLPLLWKVDVIGCIF